MPYYAYVAYDRNGRKVKGVVEAPSESGAINDLVSKGLAVMELRPARAGAHVKEKRKKPATMFSVAEVAIFARQFATMISAGVRVKNALGILSQQEVFTKRFREALKNVENLIEEGKSLAEAFEQTGGFEPIFVNLVKAGEEGGALDRTMERLADFYESSKQLSDEIKASMRYPMFIGGFAVLVVFAMMFYIVPMMVSSIGLKPTGMIAGMLQAREFLETYKFLILGGVVGFFVFMKYYLSTMSGRIFKEKVLSLFPPIRRIFYDSAIERFARTLAILVSAGVSLTSSIEMAAQATGSRSFEEKAKKVVELIKEGKTLRDALAETKMVPQLVYEMAGTGEATGKVDEVMEKVADFYEQQVRVNVKKFVSLLEPMMIAFVGGAIAFIALSLYSAIFSYQSSMGMGM